MVLGEGGEVDDDLLEPRVVLLAQLCPQHLHHLDVKKFPLQGYLAHKKTTLRKTLL